MNQPTREEFDDLKAGQKRLEEEVRQLREQITEPIHVMRGIDLERQLGNHAELLKEISQKQDTFTADVEELKLDAKAYTGDAAIFKNKVERIESDVSTIKADMEQVKTVQSGHSKFFEEHGRRLAATATKEDLAQLEARIEGKMATKDDIAAMATKDDIRRIEATQEQILKLLQQKLGE